MWQHLAVWSSALLKHPYWLLAKSWLYPGEWVIKHKQLALGGRLGIRFKVLLDLVCVCYLFTLSQPPRPFLCSVYSLGEIMPLIRLKANIFLLWFQFILEHLLFVTSKSPCSHTHQLPAQHLQFSFLVAFSAFLQGRIKDSVFEIWHALAICVLSDMRQIPLFFWDCFFLKSQIITTYHILWSTMWCFYMWSHCGLIPSC